VGSPFDPPVNPALILRKGMSPIRYLRTVVLVDSFSVMNEVFWLMRVFTDVLGGENMQSVGMQSVNQSGVFVHH